MASGPHRRRVAAASRHLRRILPAPAPGAAARGRVARCWRVVASPRRRASLAERVTPPRRTTVRPRRPGRPGVPLNRLVGSRQRLVVVPDRLVIARRMRVAAPGRAAITGRRLAAAPLPPGDPHAVARAGLWLLAGHRWRPPARTAAPCRGTITLRQPFSRRRLVLTRGAPPRPRRPTTSPRQCVVSPDGIVSPGRTIASLRRAVTWPRQCVAWPCHTVVSSRRLVGWQCARIAAPRRATVALPRPLSGLVLVLNLGALTRMGWLGRSWREFVAGPRRASVVVR